jgi:hypothetical protein
MLFQHEAEAPPQTALTGRADNAQIHGHVWQPCVSHKPPRNKRCGKALVPALSPVPSPYARHRWVGCLPSLEIVPGNSAGFQSFLQQLDEHLRRFRLLFRRDMLDDG